MPSVQGRSLGRARVSSILSVHYHRLAGPGCLASGWVRPSYTSLGLAGWVDTPATTFSYIGLLETAPASISSYDTDLLSQICREAGRWSSSPLGNVLV